MLDGIPTIGNTQNNITTKGKTILGKDDFMKLMITQMKYQDPMNPLDSSQYSAQLAQFSSLEQLSNLNDYMKQSVEANFMMTQSINNTMTAALIGKEVKLTGNTINNQGQENCTVGYNLPANASSVKIKIYNSSGTLIKTISDLPIDKGEHKLSWNFSDNEGNRVTPGNYKIEVEAKTMNQEIMKADVFRSGIIQSLRFTESGAKLVIDGVEYQLSEILEISNYTNPGGYKLWQK